MKQTLKIAIKKLTCTSDSSEKTISISSRLIFGFIDNNDSPTSPAKRFENKELKSKESTFLLGSVK
jgi:hypothetical protein